MFPIEVIERFVSDKILDRINFMAVVIWSLIRKEEQIVQSFYINIIIEKKSSCRGTSLKIGYAAGGCDREDALL